jgi:hypothetical protein
MGAGALAGRPRGDPYLRVTIVRLRHHQPTRGYVALADKPPIGITNLTGQHS